MYTKSRTIMSNLTFWTDSYKYQPYPEKSKYYIYDDSLPERNADDTLLMRGWAALSVLPLSSNNTTPHKAERLEFLFRVFLFRSPTLHVEEKGR